jgi:pyruvate dehydrogenase E1 component alpha subunit
MSSSLSVCPKDITLAKTPANKSGSNTVVPAVPSRHKANADEKLALYKQMLLIRRFEERAGQLYGLGLIGGFCHLYIGQEAVAVGLQSALDPDRDSVITAICSLTGSIQSSSWLN